MAYDGDGEYLPGEWCTFCKVSVKCRARAEEKMKLARLEFKMPPLLTDAEIEEVLDVLPDLTKWANEITAYATEAAIHHGKEWNGFKVVEGRSNRKYRDELLVAEAAREHGYTDIYRQTLIPMTEMQKLMGKSAFEEILGDLIYKPPGKPILVEYMSTPHLQKEISQKRQQPRSITEQEKLGYAQDCVNAFSNNEELSRQRAIEADLITKQRAQLGKKVIKERKSKVSELSGKPLDGMAEVHHKDRVADKPERAFDPTNLAVIRKDEHSEYHNSDYPQNEKGYEQFEKKYKK